MKRVYVSVSRCNPGDIIADDIVNEHGILIVKANTHVDEYIIKRLMDFNIYNVPVIQKKDDIPQTENQISFEKFKNNYVKNVDVMKDVLKDLACGKNLNYEKVDEIVGSFYENITNNQHIIDCISEVRGMDDYTYTHSINVALYCMLIGKWLDFSQRQIEDVVKAGILHDIGKAKVSKEILNKKGKLNDEEFKEIKKHTIYGYNMAKNIKYISKDISEAILMHHEREDGSGYPRGIKDEDICLYAKVIAVADVYDALTSERVYKKRITPFEAFDNLQKEQLGHLNTKIMLVFLSNIVSYYIGAEVMMNNGQVGKVVYIPIQNICEPIVKIENDYIDLSENKNLKIIQMV